MDEKKPTLTFINIVGIVFLLFGWLLGYLHAKNAEFIDTLIEESTKEYRYILTTEKHI